MPIITIAIIILVITFNVIVNIKNVNLIIIFIIIIIGPVAYIFSITFIDIAKNIYTIILSRKKALS